MNATHSQGNHQEGLGQVVYRYLERYFIAHDGMLPPPGLYKRFLQEVEKPLLQVVLQAVKGNQMQAAEVLGINRNTLRKKLLEHGLHK